MRAILHCWQLAPDPMSHRQGTADPKLEGHRARPTDGGSAVPERMTMTFVSRPALIAALFAAGLASCDRPPLLPDLGLSRESLAFEAPGGSGDPEPQSFFALNTGAGSLEAPAVSISYRDRAGWLATSLVSSAAPFEIRVTAAVGNLEPGSYQATIAVASSNASSSPLQLPVTLVVPGPRFALSASILEFASCSIEPTPQTLRITNGGRGTIPVPQVAISYVGAQGWLSAELGGTPEAYQVTFRARAAGLAAGTHSATIVLTAPGSAVPAQTLAAKLAVPEPAIPVISPAAIELWGQAGLGDAGPVRVKVDFPSDGCVLAPDRSVTYGTGNPGWLTTEVKTRQARHDVLVSATTSSLAVGESRTATLRVETPAGAADVAVKATSGDFTRVPSMNLDRIEGAATPLPDGRVLVSGGADAARVPYANAEIWSPTTGTWDSQTFLNPETGQRTTFAPLATGRYLHGAAALPNGKVLLVGGYGVDGSPLMSIELFDPNATEGATSRHFGNLLTARGFRPLVLPLPESSLVAVVAGNACGAETIDVESGRVARLPFSETLCYGSPSAVLLADGRWFIVEQEDARILNRNLTWTVTSKPHVSRWDPFLGLLPDGRVIAVGNRAPTCWARGCHPSELTSSAEIWDPSTGAWTMVPGEPFEPLVQGPESATVLASGKVLLWNVYNLAGPDVRTDVRLLDPATGAVSTVRQNLANGVRAVRTSSGRILALNRNESYSW